MRVLSKQSESSDGAVLDHLRRTGSATVSQLAESTGVTATAVRQRLNRLMGEGLVERATTRQERGRPSHHYSLTQRGVRSSGTNYADLAMTLWEEIRSVKQPEVRRGLIERIGKRLAERYREEITGDTTEGRLASLASLMGERDIPIEINTDEPLPQLRVLACPYPELAEQDRSVCAMERMLLSEVIGEGMRLTTCRLDGDTCCTFAVSGG